MRPRVSWALGLLLCMVGAFGDPGCELRGIRKTRGAADETNGSASRDEPRLPSGINPVSYYLQLQPFIDHDTFRGHVFINISVSEATNVITLHAASDLRVKRVSLDEAYSPLTSLSATPVVTKTERDPENSLLFVRLSEPLQPNAFYRFGAEFSGHVNTKTTEGLFKAHYVDQESGETRWYVGATFKPSLARSAFPCFDEPSMKAVVTVSIARPRDSLLRSLSNMPHAMTLPMINDPTWVWDTFEVSPPMPANAITFLTSDLVNAASQSQEEVTASGVEVRVWSRAAHTDQTSWARRLAPLALSQLEKKVRVRFPLPKLDLVALPGFSAATPASNWGLIFYREGDILSTGQHRWVTSYVISELTLQWFGGLVTPSEWAHTWINKALSKFIAHATEQELTTSPEERNALEQSQATDVYSLYYEFSRRIPYNRQPALRQSITVSKAEVILRMLNTTLAKNTMALALQDLLTENQYSTYEPADLWNAVEKRAHADGSLPLTVSARAVAETWMSSERFPVLTVTRDYLGSIDISQRVFVRDPVPESDDTSEEDDEGDSEGLWWVPVVLAPQTSGATSSSPQRLTPDLWMPPTRRIDNLSDPAQLDKYLLVNPKEIGLVMVNYDRRNWALLAAHMRKGDLSASTRAKLLHDALNLAMGGALDFPSALEVTRFLATETRYETWHPFFNMADHLLRKLDGTAAGKLFGEYVMQLVLPLDKEKAELGEGKLKSNARHLLCSLGHEPCVKRARDTFSKWSRGSEQEVKLPTHVLCPVLSWGPREEYKLALERVLRPSPSLTPEDRAALIKSLAGCAKDPWRIEKLLNASFLVPHQSEGSSEGPFTENEQRVILLQLATSHSGYLTLLRFLQKHFDVLKSSYQDRSNLWTTMIGTATAFFKTYDELQMVTEFARHRRGQFGSAEGTLRHALTRVELEAAWSQQHLGEIQNWLMNQLA